MHPVRRGKTAQVMPEENVELVRQALNAFVEVDEGLVDPQRLFEFFAPDSIFDLGEFPEVTGPGGSEIRGAEFLEWRAAWINNFDDWTYNAEKILDAGANRVLATFYQRGKPHGSESWVEMRYGLVYTVENGVIARAKLYATPEDALEAAGLLG